MAYSRAQWPAAWPNGLQYDSWPTAWPNGLQHGPIAYSMTHGPQHGPMASAWPMAYGRRGAYDLQHGQVGYSRLWAYGLQRWFAESNFLRAMQDSRTQDLGSRYSVKRACTEMRLRCHRRAIEPPGIYAHKRIQT